MTLIKAYGKKFRYLLKNLNPYRNLEYNAEYDIWFQKEEFKDDIETDAFWILYEQGITREQADKIKYLSQEAYERELREFQR